MQSASCEDDVLNLEAMVVERKNTVDPSIDVGRWSRVGEDRRLGSTDDL